MSEGKPPYFTIAGFLVAIALQWTIIRNGGISLNDIRSIFGHESQDGSTALQHHTRKVVIGAVSCQKPGTGNIYNEETALMMKSAVVSALLYKIPHLEFRLFLEDIPGGRKFFRGKLREWGFPKPNLKITLHYHSALEAIPPKYHDRMIYDKKYRCGFVRHFFPSALPNVDSIIYLDTDMIITGNLAELWNYLPQQTEGQLIGVARNNEPEDKNYDQIHIYGFGDIPHVPPKGVNSGMLVMNLTKMRDYEWQTRVVRLYQDYMKITGWLEDQRLLNIILYYDPSIHQLVPCQFDLMHTHCDKGWVCPAALEDKYGVHVIHGAGDQFDEGGSYYHIYEAYKTVNLTETSAQGDHDAQTEYLLKQLIKPIREAYREDNEHKSKVDSQCYGTLDKQLFKNWEEMLS